MKDSNRAKVYAAEHIVQDLFDTVEASAAATGRRMPLRVAGSTLTLPVERRFADVASIQRYADHVTRAHGYPPVKVRGRRGAAASHYEPTDGGIIATPVQLSSPQGRRQGRELVILHELAHHIAGARWGHQAHFRTTFIALLTTHIGPEAGLLMQVTYADQGLT